MDIPLIAQVPNIFPENSLPSNPCGNFDSSIPFKTSKTVVTITRPSSALTILQTYSTLISVFVEEKRLPMMDAFCNRRAVQTDRSFEIVGVSVTTIECVLEGGRKTLVPLSVLANATTTGAPTARKQENKQRLERLAINSWSWSNSIRFIKFINNQLRFELQQHVDFGPCQSV